MLQKLTEELAYLLGAFVADGSLYKSGHGLRVEFSDGTSVKEELHFSKKFVTRLRNLIEKYFDFNIRIHRKNNKYVLKFRNKKFANWIQSFGFLPGDKSNSVDIPSQLRGTSLEKSFWLGVMDCDGMIGRTTKNVTLWSSSKKLCKSFCEFLNKKIPVTVSERKLNDKIYFYVKIRSPFVKAYFDIISFSHPRKLLWLKNHLKNEFYVTNSVNFKEFLIAGNVIDYSKIFSKNVFVVRGSKILREEIAPKNMRFKRLLEILRGKGLSNRQICGLLQSYRWKMSKGSTTSVKLPLIVTGELEKIAKFIRLREGGIGVSKNYINSCGENSEKIIKCICKMFDVKPHFTSKKEIFFDSGVLKEFFSKVVKRE